MLLSLVLAFSPTEPVTPRGFYGRQARAWFLGQIQRHDPALAEALHSGDGARCYTVSDLWRPPGRLMPGDTCYLRLTSLAGPLQSSLSLSRPRLRRINGIPSRGSRARIRTASPVPSGAVTALKQ